MADELGWSRAQVSQYASLDAIDKGAWEVIATAVTKNLMQRQNGDVADNATPVAFSENLLRSIIPLKAEQQLKLVKQVAEAIGWSRDLVARFAALRQIHQDAWDVVVTTTTQNVTGLLSGLVTENVTCVTPFTEGILRSIIPLKAEQQLKLVKQVADEIGWSREKIRNYSNLESISPEAWKIIGTAFQEIVPSSQNNDVPGFGTNVPFSEGLLRSIIPLKSEQQIRLVKQLAKGTK